MITYEIGTKFNNVLTDKVIESWEGKNVILNGATGSGKTYFIENGLHDYASRNFKNILFLCNRTALYRDVLLEIKETSLYNIEAILYQTLQEKIKDKESIGHYDYIVCDEFHYVLTDAMFNIYTDLTYNWIISQTDSTKIFMSGTGQTIFNLLKHKNIVKEENEYYIPYDYSYADLVFYDKKENTFDIINHVLTKTDDKVIYFANSTDMALKVYNQFKDDANFRVSESCKDEEANKLNEPDCIQTYNRNLITFDNRLLISTKCLDNGINIVDRQVKHIICDVFDLESAQQCLGRKRKIDKDDRVTFYIRDYDKKSLRNFKGSLNKELNPLHLFIKNRDKFDNDNKYGKNREFHSNYIFNDGEIRKYNKLAYVKMLSESNDIKIAQKVGYAMLFLTRLGDTINSVKYFDELNIKPYELKDELTLYLEDLIGIRLYDKEKQDELINKINLTDSKGRQLKSIKSLKGYLEETYNLSIISTRDKRKKLDNGKNNPNRDKTYWEIIQLVS